jgi:hypothetical protein
MVLHLILGTVAVLAGASIGGLVLVIVGIHRSERGKRLTGLAAGPVETFTRRLLAGTRGCDDRDTTGEGR